MTTALRRWLVLGAVLLTGILLPAGQARPTPPRLLMVTYSAGYEHEVVRRPTSGGPSLAERVVADLARRTGRFNENYVETRGEREGLSVASVHTHKAMLI